MFYNLSVCQNQNCFQGYSWEFKESDSKEEDEKKKKNAKDKAKEETGSLFQRQRVNILLNELAKKFPLKPIQTSATNNTQASNEQRPPSAEANKVDVKTEIKTEPQTGKPPPEKKPRLA